MTQTTDPAIVKQLDDILTKAISQTCPAGTRIDSLSMDNRIGTLILLKVVKHLAGVSIGNTGLIQMGFIYAAIGTSLGRVPDGPSSVAMMNWRN